MSPADSRSKKKKRGNKTKVPKTARDSRCVLNNGLCNTPAPKITTNKHVHLLKLKLKIKSATLYSFQSENQHLIIAREKENPFYSHPSSMECVSAAHSAWTDQDGCTLIAVPVIRHYPTACWDGHTETECGSRKGACVLCTVLPS